MNIYIKTNEIGEIEKYSMDFKPLEITLATALISQLQQKASTETGKKTEHKPKKINGVDMLYFNEQSFNDFKALLLPSPYQALKNCEIMDYQYYSVIKKRRSISKKQLDALSVEFKFQYKTQGDNITTISPLSQTLNEICKKELPADVKRRVEEEYFINPTLASLMAETCKNLDDCNSLVKKYNKSSGNPQTSNMMCEHNIVR